jgi:hypothetical protein
MKKLTLTIAALLGLSMGAYAQGYIIVSAESLTGGAYVTTNTAYASSPNSWPSGGLGPVGTPITVELWAANPSDASVASTINNADLLNGATAVADMMASDDFTEVYSTSLTIDAGYGVGEFTQGSTQIAGLTGGLVSSGNSVVMVEVIDGNLEGVIGGLQGIGTSQSPVDLNGWNATGNNLLLSPVPEPATLALAGLGGLSLLLFRRRNK